MLCRSQSARAVAAYAYSAAGPGESTTDLAWDGQGVIYELGDLLAESERFPLEPPLCIADVDTGRILGERMRMQTFNDMAEEDQRTSPPFRRVLFEHRPSYEDIGLIRPIRRFPYVPNRKTHLDQDCYEAFNIQVEGLRRRFEATSGTHMVIGVSGGLDSTHALIVAAKVCDRLDLPRSTILGFTMPGFATGDETKDNAWKLMRALGITAEEIDIRPAALQMLRDMRHPFAGGEPVYDIAFENVQAGLRTDYLFRLANQRRGFVIGTGDLSELALGWCTYGVGDQMSHYAVNAGVPKTLIQYLIRWAERTDQFDRATDEVLEAILATEISPELIRRRKTASRSRAPRRRSAPTSCTTSSSITSCAMGRRRRRSPSWRCTPGRTWRRAFGRSTSRRRRGTPTIWGRSAGGWRCSWSASSR